MGLNYVDTFPAFAQGQNGVKQYLKNLPASHELRSVVIEFNLGIKQGAAGPAAAFSCKPNTGLAAGGANDALIIANALLNRVYLKENEQANAVNIKVLDAQICHGAQHGFSMLNEAIHDGDPLPANGAAAATFRLDVMIDFLHSAFETPNKYAPGTEQAILNGGWEVSYDTNGASNLAALAITGGNVVVVVNQARLLADVHPVDAPIVAPTWWMQYDQELTENSERRGRFLELLVYEVTLPATLEAALNTINVYNDGLIEQRQTTPLELANSFARTCKPRDAFNPFVVERNCSPIRWAQGRVTAEERELPFTLSGRTINFQGSTALRSMVRHRISPQSENLSIISAVMAQAGIKGDPMTLKPRFPSRDAALDMLFATRVVA